MRLRKNPEAISLEMAFLVEKVRSSAAQY